MEGLLIALGVFLVGSLLLYWRDIFGKDKRPPQQTHHPFRH
jgi:hypothetical protein